jgi:hypothetical protein
MIRPAIIVGMLSITLAAAAAESGVRNTQGVTLVVNAEDTLPALDVVLPGEAGTAIKVIFPEHVTVKPRGSADAEHLYLYRPGKGGDRPVWRTAGNSLEYESELKQDVHLLARATLEDDGILFHYELKNRSKVDYEMALAITDPRMSGTLHDPRLERTYVHYKDGFALLGTETPGRLTMPLSQWFPVRYLASYTWPVPIAAGRMERRADGIAYYNTSQGVDEPLIATLSADRRWVVASFTKTTGNVWSNPELTCQHVDPAKPLSAGGDAVIEVKVLIFRGTLQEALEKERAQRQSLQ